MTSDEYRDPVVKEILDQVPPPAHGANFWNQLDAALGAELAPNAQPDLVDDNDVITPVAHDSDVVGIAADDTVVSMESFRKRRGGFVLSAAAALVVVLGAVGFLAQRETTTVDSAGGEPSVGVDQEETGSSGLSPNTTDVYKESGVMTLDNSGEYVWRVIGGDDQLCPDRELMVKRAETRQYDSAEGSFPFAGDRLQLVRGPDGQLAVIEHCGTTDDPDNLRLQRVVVGAEAPSGGFTATPEAVALTDSAPAQFLNAQWGDQGALMNNSNSTPSHAIDPASGAVVSAVKCSGAGVAANPMPASQQLDPTIVSTRAQILTAANLCDWNTLESLMGSQFGDPAGTIDQWQTAELEDVGRSRPMAQLIGVLNTRAALITDPNGSGDELWSWPEAIIYSCQDMPASVEAALLAELGYSSAQLQIDCDQIGAYAGWRTAINTDGTWEYATRR